MRKGHQEKDGQNEYLIKEWWKGIYIYIYDHGAQISLFGCLSLRRVK